MRTARALALAALGALGVSTAVSCGPDRGGSTLPPVDATFSTTAPATTDAAPGSTATQPTETTEPALVLDAASVSFERVTAALDRPVDLAWRAGDPAVYIVEQGGTVVPVTTAPDGTAQVGEPVLDLSDMVSDGNEQGLLALEFHPTEPFAYANYTDRDGDTQIVEFAVADSDGTALLERESQRVLLTVAQPYANHNGGDLIFDDEGMLLVTLGDGGSGGDPERVSLDLRSMLGKILRIDPRPATGEPYGVPPDNPFVGVSGALPEIWSVGLRNPWRVDLDPATGALWVADVGQGDWEEVTVVDTGRGVNFGWSAFEGTHRFNDDQDGSGATPPAFEYEHGDTGCSVSGGAVLEPGGWFVFSDYCSGRVWAMQRGGSPVRIDAADDDAEGLGSVAAVRRDGNGDLYVLVIDGRLLRLSVERP